MPSTDPEGLVDHLAEHSGRPLPVGREPGIASKKL
jgi:hypothetical protein